MRALEAEDALRDVQSIIVGLPWHEPIRSLRAAVLHYRSVAGTAKAPTGMTMPARRTETQVDAQRRYEPRAGTLRAAMLAEFRRGFAMTDLDLLRTFGGKHQTISAARNALMNAGLIAWTGKTRDGRRVWKVVD